MCCWPPRAGLNNRYNIHLRLVITMTDQDTTGPDISTGLYTVVVVVSVMMMQYY